MRNFLATLNNWALLPSGTIHRGNGKFDFYADETSIPQIIKEKLIELEVDATVVFKKGGENTKLSAGLKKEGKPISINDDKVKAVKK